MKTAMASPLHCRADDGAEAAFIHTGTGVTNFFVEDVFEGEGDAEVLGDLAAAADG